MLVMAFLCIDAWRHYLTAVYNVIRRLTCAKRGGFWIFRGDRRRFSSVVSNVSSLSSVPWCLSSAARRMASRRSALAFLLLVHWLPFAYLRRKLCLVSASR